MPSYSPILSTVVVVVGSVVVDDEDDVEDDEVNADVDVITVVDVVAD